MTLVIIPNKPRPFISFGTAILLLAALGLVGCGMFKHPEVDPQQAAFGVRHTAPAGQKLSLSSFLTPQIPTELEARAQAQLAGQTNGKKLYQYTVDIKSPKDTDLALSFSKLSRLNLMKDESVSRTTLEQRLNVSLKDAHKLLESQGYYEGKVTGKLDFAGKKVKASIVFEPGARYKVGSGRVILIGSLNSGSKAALPPQNLAQVGLALGAPAVASHILEAVSRVEGTFRNRGYPEAKVESTRYIVDKKAKTVEAEIRVNPYKFALMGNIKAKDASVHQDYLEALRTWKVGQPWNQELMGSYLTALRQTGLFQVVEAHPGTAVSSDPSLLPIVLTLAKAPERTVGGMVSYDTDFGPGLNAYWEHRNLTGHGDRLRFDLPVWADMKQLTARYRYPYFLSPDQDLIAQAGILHEDTDAYELMSTSLFLGLERRLSPRWLVSATGTIEGGTITDPGQPKEDFIMLGLPVTVTYNNTNSLLDPTSGMRLLMLTAPYSGTFRNKFNVVQTRLEGHGYIPLGSDRLVLAMRAAWGTLWNADESQDVPSSLRFYTGGGGSVRGYAYQSIGPRNADDDPLGGVTLAELSLETRLRFSETMGLVAFLDGGMVYRNLSDDLYSDMLWGTGLGFRYYTPIGPASLDVAVPLDRRPGDDPWQLYISLGQSF